MELTFNPLFSNLKITVVDHYKYSKSLVNVLECLNPEDYITLDGIQDIFEISRYQLNGYLKILEIDPIGEIQNIVDGRRLRGVGKLCYEVDTVDKIYDLIASQIDIEEIKRQAAEYIKSFEDEQK